MKEYVLGIDMGTSSVKVGLFDLEGHAISFADEAYPLYIPRTGWAEQNVDEWWNGVCKATRNVMKDVNKDSVIGMSVDTTGCTVLFADENMNILRPALLWMDARASKQAKQITQTNHDALKQNGYGSASVESMPAKALWIKEKEPGTYRKAKYVFECVNWLVYKLTGELTATITNSAPRWYYNRAEGGWPYSFYEAFGLDDIIDKFPKVMQNLGDYVGPLTSSAANDLGLKSGTPVGQGGLDAFVGMIGLNVVEPGRLALITGTSHLLLGLSDHEIHSKGMWGSYLDAVIPGLHMVEGGQITTGAIVNWFKSNFCANIDIEAKKRNINIYQMLEQGVSEIPIGADGLLSLDFFQGNRTPYADPDIRGMLYGLSINHTPYHIYRALLEGICYGTQNIVKSFCDAGIQPKSMYMAGGAVNSRFWVQMHADVSNLPVLIPEVPEASCLGSAILGSVASKQYSSIQEASSKMVHIKEEVYPDKAKNEEYQFYFNKYIEAYNISKVWMHDITNHLNDNN